MTTFLLLNLANYLATKKNKKVRVETNEVDTSKELFRLLKIAVVVVIIFAIL